VVTEGRADRPVDAFVIEDEPMGDGRTIHYYVWPDSGEEEGPSDPAAATEAPADV
jgi:hypothetical protein